jgi:hypothetical protein
MGVLKLVGLVGIISLLLVSTATAAFVPRGAFVGNTDVNTVN